MVPIPTLLSSSGYADPPAGMAGWIAFLIFCGLIAYLLWLWRGYNVTLNARRTILLITLVVITPLTSLFLGLQLPIEATLTRPGIPAEPTGTVVMFLAAVPWVLAAGLLGPIYALAPALLSGSIMAYWQTHHYFTPLEVALMAIIFAAAVRQRYRTRTFRLARQPLITAICLVFFFPVLHLAVTPFMVDGFLAVRLDYALNNLLSLTISMGVALLVAGLVGQIVRWAAPGSWGGSGPLEPSPAERSLQMRFLVGIAPIAAILILALMIGNWYVAGRAAREMLRARMAGAAALAAENVPYFLESGQNIIEQIAADPRLMARDPASVSLALEEDIKTGSIFNQLTVVDAENSVIASFPTDYNVGPQSPADEQLGIQDALSGVAFQFFTVPPAVEQTTAQISFVQIIPAGQGAENSLPQRILIGRSALVTETAMIMPSINSLNSLADIDGQGLLIDENDLILVHPNPEQVMTTYTGRTGSESIFYDETAPDGTRRLVYYQPAQSRPWSVVLMVPAHRAQQLALSIAMPLLMMIAILALASLIMLRLGLRVVTGSLQTLTEEAGRIAQGKLDQPLVVEGVDEVGQLGRSFEQMRISLKARLEELNRLLAVSQGVASSLEISEMVQPILDSALAAGGSAARLVLAPSMAPERQLFGETAGAPVSFGVGPSQNLYRGLDEQILALTRGQDRLVLTNLLRPRILNFTPGAPRPESLLAVALRHENQYYGALWITYDQPHPFSEEEVRFMVTLAGQAALAAANARLFLNAEIGRRRMESILASSPDPVLVTDQRDRLLLANPAAWSVLGLGAETGEGQPIEKVISESELVDLLRTSSAGQESAEVTLPGGRVFLATATAVMAEGQRAGRVCVLRDVTHFKELDALKSEFVSTVSHDLRSPLTLMRGYATMLEMVGQLNEQQTGYVRKIIGGVETMSRLVNNLLDLGRIEAGVGLQLETIPVQDVVERVVGALQLQATQKHITLSVEFPAQTVPLVEADQALLQQALHNLIENAIKYTRPSGKVHVRVQIQSSGVIFEVVDNGIGISPMDLPRLFEKFYRGAQQAAREQRGTGLGLAIVKSIAERHGGRVWAESQLGKGSTFYLIIPLRQPRPQPAA